MRVYTGEKRDATKRPLTAEEAVKAAAIYRDVVKEDVFDPVKLQAELQVGQADPRGAVERRGLAAGPVLCGCSSSSRFLKLTQTSSLPRSMTTRVDDLIAARVGELRAVSVADIRPAGRPPRWITSLRRRGFGRRGSSAPVHRGR